MTFVDTFVAEILHLEVRILNARARLVAGTDPEALHDLRIAVRRIRSLLIPVRRQAAMLPLKEAAAAIGRLTTPPRDLEVIAQELEHKGLPTAARRRRERLADQYRAVAHSPQLERLLKALDEWPQAFRAMTVARADKPLKRKVEKTLHKHVEKLRKALAEDGHDRHEIRILVKRTRYLVEAFNDLSPLSPKAGKSLKAVQSALGAWHDHHQWCLRVAEEADLAPLTQQWAQASADQLREAEAAMGVLRGQLPDTGV
ncbi:MULTISPECIES: CHAD domain-containing protein [Pseudomonas]|uniref:CHAD domain-containing protein n=1 Tax=Pseudomonas quercus TaxID=2722792 RepID=A0ABX0Y8V4_9PSED|nr:MULTISPECIES: CHAD domain-containing protein [Pseudomonas]MBF7141209.1 CHAD domain-containing protein [Pseudomonas sp. LY10J]NJO99744.1 CHAD domain-containing protein [Pseudomonas quercus]